MYGLVLVTPPAFIYKYNLGCTSYCTVHWEHILLLLFITFAFISSSLSSSSLVEMTLLFFVSLTHFHSLFFRGPFHCAPICIYLCVSTVCKAEKRNAKPIDLSQFFHFHLTRIFIRGTYSIRCKRKKTILIFPFRCEYDISLYLNVFRCCSIVAVQMFWFNNFLCRTTCETIEIVWFTGKHGTPISLHTWPAIQYSRYTHHQFKKKKIWIFEQLPSFLPNQRKISQNQLVFFSVHRH